MQIKSLMQPIQEYTSVEHPIVKDLQPILSNDIDVFFLPSGKPSTGNVYEARIWGLAKVHFVDVKNKIDTWQDISLICPVDALGKKVLWEEGQKEVDLLPEVEQVPAPNSHFAKLPNGLSQAKNYELFAKSLATFLYQTHSLNLSFAPEFNLISKANETHEAFKERVDEALRKKKEEQVKKLREKYAEKIDNLTQKMQRAQEKVTQKKQKVIWQIAETVLSFITTIVGALIGKGMTKGTITQAGTSLRRAGQSSRQNQDANQAEETVQTYEQQLQDAKAELQREIDNMIGVDSSSIIIDELTVKPRKSDISVEKIALIWQLQ